MDASNAILHPPPHLVDLIFKPRSCATTFPRCRAQSIVLGGLGITLFLYLYNYPPTTLLSLLTNQTEAENMGNCFGRQKSDNFSGAGRSLNDSTAGDTPKLTTTSPKPPATAKYSPTPAQGRAIGGSGPTVNDPRAAAAAAAEERVRANAAGKGKLGKQLDAQKNSNALADASRETRLARDADASVETRTWN